MTALGMQRPKKGICRGSHQKRERNQSVVRIVAASPKGGDHAPAAEKRCAPHDTSYGHFGHGCTSDAGRAGYWPLDTAESNAEGAWRTSSGARRFGRAASTQLHAGAGRVLALGIGTRQL